MFKIGIFKQFLYGFFLLVSTYFAKKSLKIPLSCIFQKQFTFEQNIGMVPGFLRYT